MDDSISCSPTLDNNKSFHMQRHRRKCKRKGMEKEKKQQSNDHNYVQSPHPLDGFGQIDEELDNPRYQTFQVHSPSTTRRIQSQLHYEMFEDVFTLADQMDCEQAARAQKQRKDLKSTQGFQTASQNITAAFSEESGETDLLGIETEFGLTKTQLFDCCDRIDQNNSSQSSIIKLNTNTTMSMSIVDIILHDFCSSPEYKADELMINDAVTAAPYFRFRGQIIKTYSRVSKTQNVALKNQDQVDQQMEDDDDRVSSCSSDLSVQEDLTNSTQLPAMVKSNIDLNSSQRLCQNLLNISAYFTANTEEDSIALNNLKSAEITSKSCSAFTLKLQTEPQMVAEEFTFDKNYSDAFNEDISWSFDDYHWFSSSHSIQSPVKLKESDFKSEDKHISLSDIDQCHSENYDNKPTTYENLKIFLSSEKISKSKSKNCDDHLIMESSKNNLCNKEANISLKSDDWFNDDFDYDFNTEDILIKTKEDFVVSENHETTKIDDTKAKSIELLKDKKASVRNEYIEEKPCTSRQAMQRINAIHTSKETNDHENKLKGNEELNYELSQWLLDDIAKQKCDNELETTKTVGFCTAKNKSIHVSDAAKRKVASIVAELPDLPIKTSNNKRKSYPMISKDKLEDDVEIDKLQTDEHNCDKIELSQWLLEDVIKHKSYSQIKSTTAVGFWTVGNKSIQRSDAATRKAASIVAELPELPMKSTSCDHIELSQWLLDDVDKQKCDNEVEPPPVVGYCTSGNKNIQVSDAANRKAASIVAKLPELPEKSKNDNTKFDPAVNLDRSEAISIITNDPLDSKMNELQADEENVCANIELSQWLLEDVGKPKCDNELKPPTIVAFCTAGNKCIQVSDAAKRKAASIVAELPELPVIDKAKIESSTNEVLESKINILQADQENVSDNIELSQWLLEDVGKPKCNKELKPPIVGFCTAGNKSIQVSDAAKRKAASIVAELLELSVKDDDKIESSSNEVDSKINELLADEENVSDNIELSQWLLDDLAKQKCVNELEPTPIVVGFCTARNKSIQISDAAKRKAASIVSELPALPIKDKEKIESCSKKDSGEEHNCDHIELSQWLLDDVAKQKGDNKLEPPTVIGLGISGNKTTKVSDAAKRMSVSIVSELPYLPNKNSKEELEKEIKNKRKLDETFIETSVDKIMKYNELEDVQLDYNKIEMRKWSLDEAANLNSENNLNRSNNIDRRKCSLDEAAYRNSGNNLNPRNFPKTIYSEKSKIDARINLIKWEVRSVDFSSQKNNDDDVKDQQEPGCYSLQRRLSLLNDITTKQKTDAPLMSTTFNTERNSSIINSEAASQKAESIVSLRPHGNGIKELKTNTTTNKRKLEEINIKQSVDKIMKINNAEDEEDLDCENIELSKWLLNGVTDHITDTEFCSTPIVGFCSAGNKSTPVTKAASITIVPGLPEFPVKKTNKRTNEDSENVPIVNKMKLEDSSTETPVKSSVIILSKSQALGNFRTPQASFQLSQTQSSFTELLARSPLEKYTKSSIISRKNLLTLNKKRKIRHSQNDDECIETLENMMIDADHTEDLGETPTRVKQKFLHQMETNQTPHNSNVYMNSLATSTPQPLKSINGEMPYDLENDFQHIKWQTEEGELSKTLTNSATKPSPKERIERLRIYGNPPALSPITTSTISSLSANSRSFRAPGLRRRRILSKPK